jgi:glycerol-3-phosphate acyltransferase PlsY
MRWLALVAGAYLLGSVSFSYVIVRVLTGCDVRALGSGNAGATNAARAAGTAAGVLTLALDIAKGVTPVLIARQLGAPPLILSATASAAVLGHVFPVFFGFRGGKGVATAAAALGALAPRPLALCLVAFALVFAWKRYVSLASVLSVGLFPVMVFACGRLGWSPERDGSFLASATIIPLLVVYRHVENLRRLRVGSEPKMGLGEERRARA